jgi:hypothetical protein
MDVDIKGCNARNCPLRLLGRLRFGQLIECPECDKDGTVDEVAGLGIFFVEMVRGVREAFVATYEEAIAMLGLVVRREK